MARTWTDLFAEPVEDLGDTRPELRGIFAPRSERAATKRGVTAQFLENAADYHQRYTNVGHFRVLIDDALARLEPQIDPKFILDIGSGSGNSVIPLLDRFPQAFVVATDISPQLLTILRDHLTTRPQYRGRFALVCMDASNDCYRTGGFDLAAGAAILHHILEPEAVIRACGNALRPGGAAIFFEPFELGHALLNLAYGEIVAEADRRDETGPGIHLLRHLHGDYAARAQAGTDAFSRLDDKWMFTREFFESHEDRDAWAACVVYPIHGIDAPLTAQTHINLKLVSGVESSALPDWAWNKLARYESAFTQQSRRDLMIEGAIVMRVADDARIDGGSGWWWNSEQSGRGVFVEMRGGVARLVCCSYDDDGNPAWHAAGPATVGPDGQVSARLRPFLFPRASNVVLDSSERSLAWRFWGPREALMRCGDTGVALQPQHAQNAGFGTPPRHSLTGCWIEDSGSPTCAVLVEDLDRSVFAALLSASDWSVTTASRSGRRTYEGEWLRFRGGQTIDGPYRAPSSSEAVGAAQLAWTERNSLVVTVPGGRQRALVRAASQA